MLRVRYDPVPPDCCFIFWDGSEEAWELICSLWWDNCYLNPKDLGVVMIWGVSYPLKQQQWVGTDVDGVVCNVSDVTVEDLQELTGLEAANYIKNIHYEERK